MVIGTVPIFREQTISFNSYRSANGTSGRHHDGQREGVDVRRQAPGV